MESNADASYQHQILFKRIFAPLHTQFYSYHISVYVFSLIVQPKKVNTRFLKENFLQQSIGSLWMAISLSQQWNRPSPNAKSIISSLQAENQRERQQVAWWTAKNYCSVWVHQQIPQAENMYLVQSQQSKQQKRKCYLLPPPFHLLVYQKTKGNGVFLKEKQLKKNTHILIQSFRSFFVFPFLLLASIHLHVSSFSFLDYVLGRYFPAHICVRTT